MAEDGAVSRTQQIYIDARDEVQRLQAGAEDEAREVAALTQKSVAMEASLLAARKANQIAEEWLLVDSNQVIASGPLLESVLRGSLTGAEYVQHTTSGATMTLSQAVPAALWQAAIALRQTQQHLATRLQQSHQQLHKVRVAALRMDAAQANYVAAVAMQQRWQVVTSGGAGPFTPLHALAQQVQQHQVQAGDSVRCQEGGQMRTVGDLIHNLSTLHHFASARAIHAEQHAANPQLAARILTQPASLPPWSPLALPGAGPPNPPPATAPGPPSHSPAVQGQPPGPAATRPALPAAPSTTTSTPASAWQASASPSLAWSGYTKCWVWDMQPSPLAPFRPSQPCAAQDCEHWVRSGQLSTCRLVAHVDRPGYLVLVADLLEVYRQQQQQRGPGLQRGQQKLRLGQQGVGLRTLGGLGKAGAAKQQQGQLAGVKSEQGGAGGRGTVGTACSMEAAAAQSQTAAGVGQATADAQVPVGPTAAVDPAQEAQDTVTQGAGQGQPGAASTTHTSSCPAASHPPARQDQAAGGFNALGPVPSRPTAAASAAAASAASAAAAAAAAVKGSSGPPGGVWGPPPWGQAAAGQVLRHMQLALLEHCRPKLPLALWGAGPGASASLMACLADQWLQKAGERVAADKVSCLAAQAAAAAAAAQHVEAVLKRAAEDAAARQAADAAAAMRVAKEDAAAKQAAERKAAEEEAKQAAERKAAEQAAKQAAERKATEQAAKQAAERKAAEQAAKQAAERKAAEEEAKQAAERKAVEQAEEAGHARAAAVPVVAVKPSANAVQAAKAEQAGGPAEGFPAEPLPSQHVSRITPCTCDHLHTSCPAHSDSPAHIVGPPQPLASSKADLPSTQPAGSQPPLPLPLPGVEQPSHGAATSLLIPTASRPSSPCSLTLSPTHVLTPAPGPLHAPLPPHSPPFLGAPPRPSPNSLLLPPSWPPSPPGATPAHLDDLDGSARPALPQAAAARAGAVLSPAQLTAREGKLRAWEQRTLPQNEALQQQQQQQQVPQSGSSPLVVAGPEDEGSQAAAQQGLPLLMTSAGHPAPSSPSPLHADSSLSVCDATARCPHSSSSQSPTPLPALTALLQPPCPSLLSPLLPVAPPRSQRTGPSPSPHPRQAPLPPPHAAPTPLCQQQQQQQQQQPHSGASGVVHPRLSTGTQAVSTASDLAGLPAEQLGVGGATSSTLAEGTSGGKEGCQTEQGDSMASGLEAPAPDSGRGAGRGRGRGRTRGRGRGRGPRSRPAGCSKPEAPSPSLTEGAGAAAGSSSSSSWLLKRGQGALAAPSHPSTQLSEVDSDSPTATAEQPQPAVENGSSQGGGVAQGPRGQRQKRAKQQLEQEDAIGSDGPAGGLDKNGVGSSFGLGLLLMPRRQAAKRAEQAIQAQAKAAGDIGETADLSAGHDPEYRRVPSCRDSQPACGRRGRGASRGRATNSMRIVAPSASSSRLCPSSRVTPELVSPVGCARMLSLQQIQALEQQRAAPPTSTRKRRGGGDAMGSGSTPPAPVGLPGASAAATTSLPALSRKDKLARIRSTVAGFDQVTAAGGCGASASNLLADAAKWRSITARTKVLKFGRSKMHGWGLYATEPIEADDFIIEYVGEVVRWQLVDARERMYQALGLDDYMFRVDGEIVVDATRKGGPARFINHCCEPNAYTRIFTVEGVKHIGIYARRRIEAGEELSYDYKFQEETDPARKIACNCGARLCRKWMC